MAPSHRYSRFVRAMRISLPIGAVALLALLVTWPRLHGPDDDVVTPSVESVDLEQDGRVRLNDPRYVGEGDDGGAGFTVEADVARVDPAAPSRIELDRMRAELPTEGGRDVTVVAAHAVYDRDAATLDLDGGIELVTDDGYRLLTEAAEVAVDRTQLRTRTPVEGQGPRGEIVADRMEVEEGGSIVRFTGNVRLVLPQAGKPGKRGS
jgi:lipopolysaccharide export system protein LptC